MTIISCLGIDGKRHKCYPESKECLCGMRIDSKDQNKLNLKLKYDCHKCSSIVEQMERDEHFDEV